MKYFVKADHPTLRRIDRCIEAKDLGSFVKRLTNFGYENISVESTWKS